MRHQFLIVAGPNGSGKTVLARRNLLEKLPIINSADIAIIPANPHPAGRS